VQSPEITSASGCQGDKTRGKPRALGVLEPNRPSRWTDWSESPTTVRKASFAFHAPLATWEAILHFGWGLSYLSSITPNCLISYAFAGCTLSPVTNGKPILCSSDV
jgi:hypothetical protein